MQSTCYTTEPHPWPMFHLPDAVWCGYLDFNAIEMGANATEMGANATEMGAR